MQTHFFKKLSIAIIFMTAFSFTNYAQQTVIEHNSDTGAEGPQLLLLEKGDGALGLSSSDDGWARIWFQNDANMDDRWAFLARPHTGAQDTDGILTQPIIMAHNAEQIFGFGEDGTLRINKSYTLPNTAGSIGQVLGIISSSSTNKEVGWIDAGTGSADCLIDADMDTRIKLLEDDQTDTIKFTVENVEVAEMYVGRTSIFNKLDVYNNMLLNGNLIANGNLVNNGNVTATGSLNSNGNLNLTGQLNAIGGNIQIAVGDNLEVLNGNINANGMVSANGSMNANGNLNLTGQLNSVSGNIQIASGDNLELLAGNVNVNGNLNANGDIELSGQLRGNGTDVQISMGNDLQVLNGNLMVNGTGIFSGTVSSTCGVLTCSDERYKKNVTSIDNALNKVMQIDGVYYDLRSEDFPEKKFSEEKQVGLIAQNLESQFPELVATDEDGYKSVAYDKLTPVLVEAIKEQQDLIERLMKQNQNLSADVSAIKAEISRLNNISLQTVVKK